MEMTTVKTLAVMAVIFGCFAVLYPKIFHPIILSAFGAGSTQQQTDDLGNRLPPHLKKPNMGNARPLPGGGPQDDIARHMRAGPHPGMRAAAEMQKQVNTQGSGGKGGMMTVVLPMYAIGIVVYLIYTLSKVFGGRKKSADEEYVKRHFNKRQPLREVRYDAERKKFLYGEEDSEEEDDDTGVRSMQRSRKQQRDLERLLFKADREKISDLEMHELKRRLLETESQMTRILQAMETVQERVPNQMMEEEQHFDDEEYGDIREEKENTKPIRQSQKWRKKEVRRPTKNMPRKCNIYAGEKLKKRKDDEDEMESKIGQEIKNDVKRDDLEAVNGEVDTDEEYSDDFEGQEAVLEEVGPVETTGFGDHMNEEEKEGERSFEEESDSEESIPEEIDSDDGETHELEDPHDSEDVDELAEDEDSEVEKEDEGPTEEELLEKLRVKRSKGKTKEKQLVNENVDGGPRGRQEEEYAGVIDSDKEQQLNQVHKDLRRRIKPSKENQTK